MKLKLAFSFLFIVVKLMYYADKTILVAEKVLAEILA